MPCKTKEYDGNFYLLCHREGGGGSGQKCLYCHRSRARLCDFEIEDGKTCDAPMCDFCTHRAERRVDYCQTHRPSGQQHKPRKDENAPRWMKAIYPGKCQMCWKFFGEGEKILWIKKNKDAYCEPCGKAVLERMKKI